MMKALRTALGSGMSIFWRAVMLNALHGVVSGLAVASLIPLLDCVLTGRPYGGWLMVLTGLMLLGLVTHFISAMAGYRVAIGLMGTLQQRIGDKITQLPMGWFQRASAAQVADLTAAGAKQIGSALAHSLGPIVEAITSGLVLFVVAIMVDWRLGVVLVIGVGLVTLAQWFGLRLTRGVDEKQTATRVEANARILEFARRQAVLRSSGRSESFTPLESAIDAQTREVAKGQWLMAGATMLAAFALQATLAALVAIAAYLGLGGRAEPTVLVGLLVVCLRATQPISNALEQAHGLELASAQLKRVNELMAQPLMAVPERFAELSRPGEVALDSARFGYDHGPDVIDDVSFQVAAGTMTAIVGPSGSGKSTLIQLVARFHDVRAGTVSVGGCDVRLQPTEQLMGQLAIVSQDVYLLDDTLRANVRMGSEAASEEEVAWAADLAGVTEIVERLPAGWDTPVGEAGGSLSGGERQRVSIARALLKRASIVLLDEATSAIDPTTERTVSASLEQLRGQSTIIAVAHKLETIRGADQIVMLTDSGAVRDVGSHEELLGRCPQYSAFWANRLASKDWILTN